MQRTPDGNRFHQREIERLFAAELQAAHARERLVAQSAPRNDPDVAEAKSAHALALKRYVDFVVRDIVPADFIPPDSGETT